MSSSYVVHWVNSVKARAHHFGSTYWININMQDTKGDEVGEVSLFFASHDAWLTAAASLNAEMEKETT